VRFMEHGFKNPLEIIIGKATITEKERNSTKHNYSVIVKERTRFLENTLYFPGWKVFANGKEIPVEFQDQRYRGLITFYLEPGQYDIDVKFENTKLRMAADGISLISILIIISYVCFSIFLKHINEKVEYNKDI